MISFFAASRLPPAELARRAEHTECLVLDPPAAGSEEELALALHLAEKSFGTGRGIAKRFKYEFLLWLTGKTDIRSAIRSSAPKDTRNVLVVVFSGGKGRALEALEAEEKKGTLEKKSGALRLEAISLSRVRN